MRLNPTYRSLASITNKIHVNVEQKAEKKIHRGVCVKIKDTFAVFTFL